MVDRIGKPVNPVGEGRPAAQAAWCTDEDKAAHAAWCTDEDKAAQAAWCTDEDKAAQAAWCTDEDKAAHPLRTGDRYLLCDIPSA